MSADQFDPKEAAARLLAHLRRLKNDRGAMADLRCALSPTKLPRAWPLLARVGGIGNPRIEAVVGLFAYHPDETDNGNLGTTCLRLKKQNESFDGRFRRLLSCDRDEICERLRPVVLAARAKGIPINYEELFADLCYWGDNVKARWAQEYWGSPGSEEPAAVSVSEATP
ncbi:MAG: type I-E CRISPR-associated protein Cse2/CasB [Acidobacteriia bacterium]|nr:type I-E CRISPR-associated protein Cse2/CasB [Terriglobia bacterium]